MGSPPRKCSGSEKPRYIGERPHDSRDRASLAARDLRHFLGCSTDWLACCRLHAHPHCHSVFLAQEFRINDIALGLVERGHKVTVLTGKPNYPDGQFFRGYGFFARSRDQFQGVEILRVPLIPRGRTGFRLALNYLSFALFASVLAPLRCRASYDAILVFEPSPITVGLPSRVLRAITGTPVFFWVQDLWPESLEATGAVRSAWVLKLVERLTRFIYRGCDRVLVQSRAFIEPTVRMGVSRDRIAYFPNSAEALYQPCVLPEHAPERQAMPPDFGCCSQAISARRRTSRPSSGLPNC